MEGLEGMPKIRLACGIPHEAGETLLRLIVRLDLGNKKKAITYLMEMALQNPSHELREFQTHGTNMSCSLDVQKEWLDHFKPYKEHHGLYNNTTFFKDSILRGLSIVLSDPALTPPGGK